MKIFADSEFTGLHKNTTLISIGMVSEDGHEFYAEFNDYDRRQVNEWLHENVITKLQAKGYNKNIKLEKDDKTIIYGGTRYISKELELWLLKFDKVELVLDVGYYDFILIIDLLFGDAINIPRWFSKAYIDINQEIAMSYDITIGAAFNIRRESLVSNIDKYDNLDKHNSLYDAHIIKDIYEESLI